MEQRDDRKSKSVIHWVKLQDESSYVLFYFGFILQYVSPLDIFQELFNKWLLPANCFKNKKWYIKDSLRPKNLLIMTRLREQFTQKWKFNSQVKFHSPLNISAASQLFVCLLLH